MDPLVVEEIERCSVQMRYKKRALLQIISKLALMMSNQSFIDQVLEINDDICRMSLLTHKQHWQDGWQGETLKWRHYFFFRLSFFHFIFEYLISLTFNKLFCYFYLPFIKFFFLILVNWVFYLLYGFWREWLFY